MKRTLVFATAAVAAAGWLVATSPTNAGYVVSGLKEYANAPNKVLTTKDCRAVYNGEVRLVSAEAFAKYLAKHPGEAVPSVARHYGSGISPVEPRLITLRAREWAGACAR